MSGVAAVADLLAELVRIPSPSGEETACADFAADVLRRGKLDVERLGDSVVARLQRGTGPRLLLASHLDTVPVGQGWTRDAHGAAWEGDRLYGRGANDAKASCAAMIAALLELAARPAGAFAGTVELALNAREETDNTGMRDVLARLGMPDGGLVGEPTGLEVVSAQGGLAVLVAEWAGSSCHAAHVARKVHDNALLNAARELLATAPFLSLPGEHPLLGPTTVVATQFRSGERHNVVPDRAEATFDARLALPHTAAEVQRLLAERLRGARVAVRSERLRPVETAADHPLVQAALAAAGRRAPAGSNTLSDMALLEGVPAVKCGPGETLRSHTPDEFVTRAEVEAGVQVYVRFVPAALAALAAVPAAERP